MSFTVPETWTFDRTDIADGFDVHVREQLPWYDLVTSAVVQIARHYIPTGGLVYDIGASTGNVAHALAPTLAQRSALVVGVEASSEMVALHKAVGKIHHAKAEEFDYEPFDLAVAMLALMFIPPREVEPLLERLCASVRPGGAIVLVERTLPPNGYPSIVTSRLTLAAKAAMGATGASIVAKELSLAGVQRPLDPAMLRNFGAVEWFRFGDFAGYLIEAA